MQLEPLQTNEDDELQKRTRVTVNLKKKKRRHVFTIQISLNKNFSAPLYIPKCSKGCTCRKSFDYRCSWELVTLGHTSHHVKNWIKSLPKTDYSKQDQQPNLTHWDLGGGALCLCLQEKNSARWGFVIVISRHIITQVGVGVAQSV